MRVDLAVIAVAGLLACASALPYAGGWNDGSRLATVESLVDRRTLAIDDSIFVRVPRTPPTPYAGDNEFALTYGTLDKMYIDGHYYSDKSPVPALWLAAVYQVLHTTTGLSARAHTDWFCYLMTIASSGLAYVVAVWATYRLGRALDLSTRWSLALAASLGLGTVSLTYARSTNSHIMMLGATAPLFLVLALIARRAGTVVPARLFAAAGACTGLGYTFDLGVGPVLGLCTLLLIGYRSRALRGVLLFCLGAAPFVLLHHAVNYHVAGTITPANSHPEFFRWPRSPFYEETMTGGLKHTPKSFALYTYKSLVEKKGFISHNLPLFLLIPATWALLRGRLPFAPEVICALAVCVGTCLLYLLTSNNYSGLCLSIRWFVPLLAPAFFVMAVSLRARPDWGVDFLILSAWAVPMAAVMWCYGPWIKHMVPGAYLFVGGGLASWFGYRLFVACRAWRVAAREPRFDFPVRAARFQHLPQEV